MDHKDLHKHIQEGKIEHSYIFAGEERELMKNFITLIVNKLDAEVYRYEDYDVTTINKLLLNKGLFSKPVVVIVDNEDIVEKKKSSKDEITDLEMIVNKPLKNYIIVLLQQAPKTTLKPQIIAFNKLSRNELVSYVQANLNISKVRAEILAVISSDDLCMVKNNVIKLKYYCQDRAVTDDDIETVCYIPETFKIFDMIDAICRLETEKAIHIYNKMKENNIGILTLMYGQYRKILQVKILLEEGKREAQIVEATGIPKFVVGNCIRMAHMYSDEALIQILHKIFEVDCKIKTGRCTDQMVYSMILQLV